MRDRKQTKDGKSCGRPTVIVLAAFLMLAFCSLLVLRIASAESRISTREATGSESIVAVSAAPQATPTPSLIQFSQATYQVTEATVQTNITLTRTGPNTMPATVDYVVNDVTATQKSDFTFASGFVLFLAGETSKTFPVLISDDAYAEGPETAALQLTGASGASLGTPSTATLEIVDNELIDGLINPIDDPRNFAAQHYHDFLNRDAIASNDQAGLDFWTQQTEICGSNSDCLIERRENVSAAFFLSVEFQNTGYFAFRFYRASFPNSVARPRGLPRYTEFLRDTQQLGRGVVVGSPNWEATLEQNKQGFALDWVDRSEFLAEYPLVLVRDQYIDKLFTTLGVTPTQAERNAALAAWDALGSLKEKRARTLRAVVDTGSTFNAQYNPAFVLLQYFGYLRRNPNDPPDNNFSGYDFWLAKLNSFSLPGEDVRDANVGLARVKRAEMVKAFLASGEYRERFQSSVPPPVGPTSLRSQRNGLYAKKIPTARGRRS
ncbi:MAG TPA: Calx-beta domain-containing protein [Pyrinomonadaceae bacterium]|nr:Calx-beta domain-containing protein [Pyrinomonadaceae bacterium]